jgi:tetratricopeptide (TPR) repeat protein
MRPVVAENPDQFKALACLGMVLYYEGKLDEAEGYFDRALQLGRESADESPRQEAAFLYAARKQREKIDPRLFRYQPPEITDGDSAYWLGGMYALLGEKQPALTWLKRTAELGDINYPWFEHDKNYDSLRSDPDYQAIMAGIRERWEENRKKIDAAP